MNATKTSLILKSQRPCGSKNWCSNCARLNSPNFPTASTDEFLGVWPISPVGNLHHPRSMKKSHHTSFSTSPLPVVAWNAWIVIETNNLLPKYRCRRSKSPAQHDVTASSAANTVARLANQNARLVGRLVPGRLHRHGDLSNDDEAQRHAQATRCALWLMHVRPSKFPESLSSKVRRVPTAQALLQSVLANSPSRGILLYCV